MNIIKYMNNITDEYILNFFKCNGKYVSRRFNKNYINRENKNVYDYLINRFNDIDENTTLKEIVYRIEHHIEIIPKCPICGNRIPYTSKYGTYCSKKCQKSPEGYKFWNNKAKETMLKRYGVKNTLESKEFRDKIKNNMIEKYGVDNCFKLESVKQKIRQTNLEKYGNECAQKSDKVRNKIRDTFNEKYYSGTEEANKLKEIKMQKSKDTMMKHYGVEHALQNKDIMNYVKEKNIQNFGYASPLQNKEIREKCYETMLEKYGVKFALQSDIIKEQRKQTCLEKYGTEYVLQNDEIKNKIKNTNLLKYSVTSPIQNDEIKNKIKNTNLEKYGVDNPGKSDEIKQKIRETNIERYGCEYPQQNEQIKKKMKDSYYEKYLSGTPEANENWKNVLKKKEKTYIEKYGSVKNYYQITYDKITQSLQKNKNNGMTKPEYQTYEYLLTLFDKDDIQFNVNVDERYPFHVDFYICSIDLFIEINAFWTHGKHLFNENNEDDRQILNSWKQKAETSKQYKSAINVWTVMDPLKYKTAKDNNLNYLPIWSNKIDVIKQVINTYLNI